MSSSPSTRGFPATRGINPLYPEGSNAVEVLPHVQPIQSGDVRAVSAPVDILHRCGVEGIPHLHMQWTGEIVIWKDSWGQALLVPMDRIGSEWRWGVASVEHRERCWCLRRERHVGGDRDRDECNTWRTNSYLRNTEQSVLNRPDDDSSKNIEDDARYHVICLLNRPVACLASQDNTRGLLNRRPVRKPVK